MNTTDEDLCLFRGEPAVVDVLEYFADDRSFLLDACCESMHEYAIRVMPTLGRHAS